MGLSTLTLSGGSVSRMGAVGISTLTTSTTFYISSAIALAPHKASSITVYKISCANGGMIGLPRSMGEPSGTMTVTGAGSVIKYGVVSVENVSGGTLTACGGGKSY